LPTNLRAQLKAELDTHPVASWDAGLAAVVSRMTETDG
jgi:hypothetical protein